MSDILTLPFMQRALLGGLLIGMLSSYYGVFVVQRGLSFLGTGLAHAAFGGIALGLLMHTEPLWIAVPFTVLVSLGITWVKDRTQLSGDTAIGIFFSVSMALGIVFLFLRQEYTSDAFTYLFGSILAISWADILIAGLIVLTTIFMLPLWQNWAYSSFDRELAISDRIPVRRDDYILAVAIAVTIVIAIKLIGIVLIAAFLVIPAATARQVSNTFRNMTIIAVLLGGIGAVFGLIISYYLDIPSGSAIILFESAVFFGVMVIGKKSFLK